MNVKETGLSVESDAELLVLARRVLSDEGYAVEEISGSEGLDLLLAENKYFVVALCAVATIDQVLAGESPAEMTLASRLKEVDLGPKGWDAYLVLLTQDRLGEDPDITRNVFDMNHDVSALRRLVRTGVAPTLSDVRHALTPFVPPIELNKPEVAQDPLQGLVAALSDLGISKELATRVVKAFKQGAQIGDVI